MLQQQTRPDIRTLLPSREEAEATVGVSDIRGPALQSSQGVAGLSLCESVGAGWKRDSSCTADKCVSTVEG